MLSLGRLPREHGHAARVEVTRVTLVRATGEHVDLIRHHYICEACVLK